MNVNLSIHLKNKILIIIITNYINIIIKKNYYLNLLKVYNKILWFLYKRKFFMDCYGILFWGIMLRFSKYYIYILLLFSLFFFFFFFFFFFDIYIIIIIITLF